MILLSLVYKVAGFKSVLGRDSLVVEPLGLLCLSVSMAVPRTLWPRRRTVLVFWLNRCLYLIHSGLIFCPSLSSCSCRICSEDHAKPKPPDWKPPLLFVSPKAVPLLARFVVDLRDQLFECFCGFGHFYYVWTMDMVYRFHIRPSTGMVVFPAWGFPRVTDAPVKAGCIAIGVELIVNCLLTASWGLRHALSRLVP
jgi:hypothetical protein